MLRKKRGIFEAICPRFLGGIGIESSKERWNFSGGVISSWLHCTRAGNCTDCAIAIHFVPCGWADGILRSAAGHQGLRRESKGGLLDWIRIISEMLWAHRPRSIEQENEIHVQIKSRFVTQQQNWFLYYSNSNDDASHTSQMTAIACYSRYYQICSDMLFQWFLPQTSRLRRNLLPPIIHTITHFDTIT